MKIKFRYSWYDEAKTILQYTAQEDWTWRDWHAGWQPIIYNLINHAGNVHILLDFRQQQRERLPVGFHAHLNSFGTQLSPKLSGQAVVVGFPHADYTQLMLDDDGTLPTKSGRLYFAQDDNQVRALLQSFAEQDVE